HAPLFLWVLRRCPPRARSTRRVTPAARASVAGIGSVEHQPGDHATQALRSGVVAIEELRFGARDAIGIRAVLEEDAQPPGGVTERPHANSHGLVRVQVL